MTKELLLFSNVRMKDWPKFQEKMFNQKRTKSFTHYVVAVLGKKKKKTLSRNKFKTSALQAFRKISNNYTVIIML